MMKAIRGKVTKTIFHNSCIQVIPSYTGVSSTPGQ